MPYVELPVGLTESEADLGTTPWGIWNLSLGNHPVIQYPRRQGEAPHQVDQFLREQRLEDLNRKIQARDGCLGPPLGLRRLKKEHRMLRIWVVQVLAFGLSMSYGLIMALSDAK